MRFGKLFIIALFMVGPVRAQTGPAVGTGSPAPDFTLTDYKGGTYALSAFHGKFVVLEWTNFDCPFVRKHYESGNMPALQKNYTARGVIWLSICSSAPGKQGNLDAGAIKARIDKHKAHQSAYLIDGKGKVGRLYGAKTTPHLFVIDPQGILRYAGAIDDKPSTDRADVATAHNFVAAALDEAMAGKPVSTKVTVSYGCSVKY